MTILTKVIQTCAACPSQWNAWTSTGQYLYLRYRFGVGTVDAYNNPNPDTWLTIPDGCVARFSKGDDLDGEISLNDFLAAAGLELAPNAEVA